MDGYVTKPIQPAALTAAIERWLPGESLPAAKPASAPVDLAAARRLAGGDEGYARKWPPRSWKAAVSTRTSSAMPFRQATAAGSGGSPTRSRARREPSGRRPHRDWQRSSRGSAGAAMTTASRPSLGSSITSSTVPRSSWPLRPRRSPVDAPADRKDHAGPPTVSRTAQPAGQLPGSSRRVGRGAPASPPHRRSAGWVTVSGSGSRRRVPLRRGDPHLSRDRARLRGSDPHQGGRHTCMKRL